MSNSTVRTLTIMGLGSAAGLVASLTSGLALAQFVVAGIDPQLSETYRSHYVQEVAAIDDDLGRSASIGAPVTVVRDVAYDVPIASEGDQSVSYP